MVSHRRSPPCPAEIIGQLAAKHTGCVGLILRMRRPGRPAMEYETLLRRLIQERVMERHPQNPQNPQTRVLRVGTSAAGVRSGLLSTIGRYHGFRQSGRRAAIPTARYAFSICAASKLSRPSSRGRHKVSRAPYAEGRSKSRVGGAVANRRPAALCVCLARFRDGLARPAGPLLGPSGYPSRSPATTPEPIAFP